MESRRSADEQQPPADPTDRQEDAGGASPGGTGKNLATRRNVVRGGVGVALAAGAGVVVAACGSTSTTKKKPTAAATTATPVRPAPARPTATISVNGQMRTVSATAETPLLYVLRDELGLKGPKFGCGLSECGACAVLLDGKQIRSCVTPLSDAKSKKIITLEGLAASYDGPGKTDGLHPLQQAWIDEQVPQCGYCQNGMIIQGADLLSETPKPTTAQIKQAMNGHLCRCGTYNGIVRAITRASEAMSS